MARLQILNFGWRLGLDEEESAKIFAEGKVLAEATGNRHALALLMNVYAIVRIADGEGDRAISHCREALRLAEESDDPGLKLAVQSVLAYSLREVGRVREALALADQVLEKPPSNLRLGAELTSSISPYITAVHFRGLILAILGRPIEALRDYDRAIELAQEHGEMEILSWAHGALAFVAQFTGDYRTILAHARHAFEIAEKIGSPVSRVVAHTMLGTAHRLNEEWSEARQALEQALSLVRTTRAGRLIEGAVLSALAETYLGAGEEELARRTATEAVAVTRRRHSMVYVCQAHLAQARVLLRTEGAKCRREIETALADAAAAIEATGARGWEPFIHEERAALARLLGDEATHQRELREAHRLFTEMDATGHAARVAQELGL
jgi:tetratricopeptide (TPR) repeat protein